MNFSMLNWESALIFLIAGVLYGGKRVITIQPMNVDLFIEFVDRFQTTSCFLSTPALALLVHNKNLKIFESLEMLMVGGSIVSKHICEAIKPYIPNGNIFTVYGMTEVDITTNSYHHQRYGSVGKPSSNVQIKIVDKANEKLGPNQQGEICFKTAVCFNGYYNDSEDTAATIKDGWVHSGDIGYFDDDGFLFVVDRMKDLLKYNNFQVG